jgi:hypothetical protein
MFCILRDHRQYGAVGVRPGHSKALRPPSTLQYTE